MSIYKSILVFFTFFLISSCSQSSFVQKDFVSVKQQIDTVNVVFPQIEYVWKSTIETNNPNISLEISKNFAEVLRKVIEKEKSINKPVKLLYFPKTVERWSNDLSSEKRKEYIRLSSYFNTSPDGKTILEYENGIDSLISLTNAKYLLFVRGIAFETDMAVKHEDIQQRERFKLFFDSPMDYQSQWYGMQVEMAIVYRDTNEVIWYNYNKVEDSKYNPRKKNEIESLCSKLLESK